MKLFGYLLGFIVLLAVIHGCQTTQMQMSEGELLYRRKCGSCHRLVGPDEHDEQTWRASVEQFGEGLTAEEKRTIVEYLLGEEEPDRRPSVTGE